MINSNPPNSPPEDLNVDVLAGNVFDMIQRGRLGARRISCSSKIWIIIGVITSIALGLLVHPVACAVGVAFVIYGLNTMMRARYISRFCERENVHNEFLRHGYDVAFNLGNFIFENMNSIQEHQDRVQADLQELETGLNSFASFLREESIARHPEQETFAGSIITCNLAYGVILNRNEKPVRAAAAKKLMVNHFITIQNSIKAILQQNGVVLNNYLRDQNI